MTYPEQNGSAQNGGGGGGDMDDDLASVMTFDTMTTITIATTTTSPDGISLALSGGESSVPGGQAAAAEEVPPSCRTGYCRNMKIFVACLAVVFLVRGALLQYTEDILIHIGRRYPITAPELNFVIGCERIGFVGTLLFVAFFGNRMHKPVAISIGTFICAWGAIIMAVPFFVSGPRLFDPHISLFAKAGLCKQTAKNVSFQTQCDLIAFKGDDGTFTFTVISVAKLLIGVGGALYASLGLVYVEEGTKGHRLPLYFGLVVCMHGFGRFAGNLLAAWFTSLPEALNAEGTPRLLQDYAVYDQERVGRWWLGYPVFASLFLCLSLMTLWFPRYISIPDWVLRRRAKRARIQQEMERRQRLKVLASKKRHASDANGSKRNKARHRGRRSKRTSRVADQSDSEQSRGVVNEVDVLAGEASPGDGQVPPANGTGQSGENPVSNGNGSVSAGADVTIDVPNALQEGGNDLDKPRGKDTGDTSSMEVNLEDTQAEDREKDFTDEESNAKKKRRRKRHTSDPDKIEPQEGTEEVSRNRRSRDDQGHPKSKRSSRTSQSGSTRKYRPRTSGAGASPRYKPRRVRFRKEKLRDLPHTVLKLLHNLRILVVMVGAILGGFYFNGYLATLPEYINVQFQRSWETSLIIAGVTGPLAWGLGTLVGGFIMFRFRSVPLVRATLVMVGCVLAGCALTMLGMAFHCDQTTSPNSTATSICGKKCECDSYKVQYEPLCGSDGKTYPSPCHAGCKVIERTDTVGLFRFTECDCVDGGYALQGACEPQCSHLVGFAITTFVAVFVVSTATVPVFILLFRSVRSRSKSFAVGFAIWVVYTLSSTLGPVTFRYPRDGRCLQWGEDCLEEKVCWSYDLQPYRLLVNGVAAIFLFASAISFLVIYLHLKRSKAKRLKQENQNMKLDQVGNAQSAADISQTGDVITNSVPDTVEPEQPVIETSPV